MSALEWVKNLLTDLFLYYLTYMISMSWSGDIFVWSGQKDFGTQFELYKRALLENKLAKTNINSIG